MTDVQNETHSIPQIKKWAAGVLNDVIDIKINGTTEKGENFIGDILFITIFTKKNGQNKNYDAVLKLGKIGILRDLFPVRAAFEREIYFYKEAIPTFTKFLDEKLGRTTEIEIYPKCYGTILEDDHEALFLQNLKTMGYDLHSRKKPMDIAHLKATLEAYGRHHAFSFALKDQNPQDFYDLCEKNSNKFPWISFSKNEIFKKSVVEAGSFINNAIKDGDDPELLSLLNKWYEEKDLFEKYVEYLNMTFDESVLSHGDCWNNNFMFSYKDGEPHKCCLLDFQLCSICSPVFDLVYHIYCVCPNEILNNAEDFKELLDIYYSSLSKNLKVMGSDPKKCFSYNTFLKHWKILAGMGLCMAGIVLPATTLDKEDVVTPEDYIIDQVIKMPEKHKIMIQERIRAVAKNVLTLTV